MLALVTGDIGVGKTTVVGQVVTLARARGYVCAGLWAPAHVVDGRKVGIETVDLSNGERRRLAVRLLPLATDVPSASREAHKEDSVASERLGGYTFDPAVLAWANRVLASAVAAQPDLLVVDEIGPLELERNGGLAPVLVPLAAMAVPRALVVVRAWLLDALRARLPGVPTAVFAVDADTRERVPKQVMDWLFATTN